MKKILSMAYTNKYRIKCPYCECEFEYQDSDLLYTHLVTDTAYVDCPSCNRPLLHVDSRKTSIRISNERL